MSLIKKLLGQKKKKPTKQSQTQQVNNAIHKLREHVAMLNKRKVHSEKQIANYNKTAQQCVKSKNRKGAMAQIKLRKQVEKRVATLENQIFNLEVQIMALDETLMNRNMLDAMKTARNAMHVENPDAMIEKVEQTQEDIAEALELQQEMTDLMSRPLVDYDEDELEAELAELDDEVMDGGLLYGGMRMNMNKSMNNKNKKYQIEEKEEFESEEEAEAQFKKLEMELNLNANIIDVQVVQTSAPKMIIAC